MPEMAFVMLMRGVWRDEVTPQTEKYPVMTLNERIVAIVRIAGFVQTYPSPRIPNKPPESPKALLRVFLKGFTGTGSSLGFGLAVFAASSFGGLGLGQSISLL